MEFKDFYLNVNGMTENYGSLFGKAIYVSDHKLLIYFFLNTILHFLIIVNVSFHYIRQSSVVNF